ncbi:MAG: efflux RND transporter periplasmic adaptor subunit [Acidobacteriaceae bacterium]|nr:efflux RND transporter periplasmic adaptor subunit [Acidobacteriaceae bacterium]
MRSRRRKTGRRIAVLMLVLAGCAAGWIRFRHAHEIPDVPTAQAHKGDFAVVVSCRGNLTAAHSVLVTAPLDVPDLQIIWLAPAGSAVKAGDLVIRFDPSKLRQDLKEKKAALDQAQASLDQAIAQARITSDQDKLDLASAKYDMEKARLEASKKAIVSAMDGQKSAIDLQLAEEKVKVQEATIQLHRKSDEAKIASQTRLRDEARAEVERTNYRLAQTELKSPLNGVVNFLNNTTQGWMNAQPYKVGDHVSSGLSIAEIPDLSTLEMEGKVDEVDRGRVTVGDDVRIHVDAFPERVFNGKLASVSLLTEQSFTEWPPSRTFRAFARFRDRDARLRPGMNSGLDIVESHIPDAVSIPAKALFTTHGNAVVYVKTKQGYIARRVHVRARNADEIAVEGIEPDSIVALANPEEQNKA